jgi:hypothetical protein
MRKFWDDIKAYLPNELSLTVSPVVDQYNEVNGELTHTITAATPPTVVLGTSTAGYLGGAGGKVQWNTANIVNGRRVRGSTYIVPIAAGAMDTDGTIVTLAVTTINTAASTMISTLQTADLFPVVWSRPLKDEDGNITRDGARNTITTGTMVEKSAILRGRRD